MTFSIVAYDQATCAVGTSSITSSPGHGQRCLHFARGVGIVLSHGKTNRYHGEVGLRLLRLGLSAAQCLEVTAQQDKNFAYRQLGIVTCSGQMAVHTGEMTNDVKGHRQGANYLVGGNNLRTEGVVEAMANEFESARGALADRLLAASLAGEKAGGDVGGSRSGFVLITRSDEMQPFGAHRDIRIDFSENVIPALATALTAYRTWERERRTDPCSTLDGSIAMDALQGNED